MFSVHTTLEEFENPTITGHFGFVFEEKLWKGNHVITVTTSFWKSWVLNNVFRPHENEKPAFLNLPGLSSVKVTD